MTHNPRDSVRSRRPRCPKCGFVGAVAELQVRLAILRICYKVPLCDAGGISYYLIMAGPTVVLDLRFRVVRPDQEVFIVFPGRDYFLHQFFNLHGCIFPELPALDLIPKRRIQDQPDLDAKLMRSRAIDAWYLSGKRGDRPSRLLSDYKKRRAPRWLPQTRGVLAGFFDRAKNGDLVVVPGPTTFSNVLIGEIDDQIPNDLARFEEITVPEVWENEKVPSRRVRWLAHVLRGNCSLDLQRRFPSPNAVRTLEREARAEIYSLAYGSYSIEDSYTSKFDVTSADFSTRDDYHLQQFFNVIAAICEQLETRPQPLARRAPRDALPTVIPGSGFDEVIDLLTSDDYIPSLSVNINSPGSLVLSCAKVVPLVAAGVLALSVLGAEPTWEALAQGKVTVNNSEATKDDACTAKVAAEVIEQLKLMGLARWQEICKKAQQLHTHTGINGKSKAEIK